MFVILDAGLENGEWFPLHHKQYYLDECVLPKGGAVLASTAIEYLNQP